MNTLMPGISVNAASFASKTVKHRNARRVMMPPMISRVVFPMDVVPTCQPMVLKSARKTISVARTVSPLRTRRDMGALRNEWLEMRPMPPINNDRMTISGSHAMRFATRAVHIIQPMTHR